MQDTLPRHRPLELDRPRLRLHFEDLLSTRLGLGWQLLLCAAVLFLVAVGGWEIRDEFQLTPILLCLVSSIFLALITDWTVALGHSLVAACVADYFFIGPANAIKVDAHFVLRLVVFGSTSLLANFLVGRLRSAYRVTSEARKSAEAANREKDEFLAILAHDLRAPLTAAQLSLQLIERQPNEEAIVLRNSIRAREACKRVNGLVVDLLDSAKAASGGIPIHRENHDVAALVRTVCDEHRLLANESGISLECSGVAEPLPAYCDANRISQLISNLVGNALKFTPRGGIVTVSISCELGRIRLSVRDTGIGMTEEQRTHAFERFWQAERSKRSGVGLGLFIVKAIVDAHHGTITVESAPGQGTTFTIVLPTSPT